MPGLDTLNVQAGFALVELAEMATESKKRQLTVFFAHKFGSEVPPRKITRLFWLPLVATVAVEGLEVASTRGK